jgi:branched-chain amino acid transport system permease protein
MGGIYALITLGLTMVYGVLRILHISHAGVFALGAYAGVVALSLSGNLVVITLIAMAVCGLVGMLMQRWVYRPLMGSSRIVPLIASIGMFILMEDLFRLAAGPYVLPLPAEVPFGLDQITTSFVTGNQLIVLSGAVGLLILTWLVINHTRLGLAWKATEQDFETAASCGINVDQAVAMNFLLGSAIAGAAGVLVGFYYNSVSPTMGSVPAYKAMAIAVLGGLGNVWGTVVASVLLGVTEAFLVTSPVGLLLPRDSIAFVALILVLLFRPYGLFGRR